MSKPTKEGWYWYFPEDGGDEYAERPIVVEIYPDPDHGLKADLTFDGQEFVDEMPGAFAGPIDPRDHDRLAKAEAALGRVRNLLQALKEGHPRRSVVVDLEQALSDPGAEEVSGG